MNFTTTGMSTLNPGDAIAFSSCSFVFVTSKVNSLSVSPVSISTESESLSPSFHTMDFVCSGDKSATTWSHIFVRYLLVRIEEVRKIDS